VAARHLIRSSSVRDFAIVIPARYQSGRLPGKPMRLIAGIPMIERTWRRCALGFPPEGIYVATDDSRIADHCRNVGIEVVMTSPECLTGTDRVAEAAEEIPAEVIINVQGDEPLFNPADIATMIDVARRCPGEVLNGYSDIDDEKIFRNPSMPKVVMDAGERLLYMSRAPIPTSKRFEFAKAWRQVCIYVFPRAALATFRAHGQKTMLEQIEDIEILRFVELEIPVRMVRVSKDSVPVDNPEDIDTVERILARQGDT
jgi:3-deoxy-manno-octulosonate cytidylyltransferase (CMP-KDO synthetase)